MSRVFAIVPAAGGGTRYGGALAKQYAPIDARPMLEHTIERLRTSIPIERMVVALAPNDREYEARIAPRPGVEPARCGGTTRAATVKNALDALAPLCAADDWILFHDAARPCVPRDALARLAGALADDAVGGLLAVPVTDTLKRADDNERAPRAVATYDRQGLWQAQTPQMFRFHVVQQALAANGTESMTDEAQAVEALAAGGRCASPRMVMGSAENIKVTYAHDLALAQAILALQAQRERSP